MGRVVAILLAIAMFAGCASAPMSLPEYYAAIIESRGVILGVIELDGRLFFIGVVPDERWRPDIEESQL